MKQQLNNTVFIDGLTQGWATVKVNFAGSVNPITGITGISYTETNTKEAIYGYSNQPLGYSIGNYSYTGTISLFQFELETLQQIAIANGDSAGSITTILPFDLIITQNKFGSLTTTRQILKNVVFNNNGRAIKQGDGTIITDIDICFSGVQWI